MVWQGLGHCADQMFLDENNDAVAEFNNSQLLKMECVDRPGVMDQWFLLHFSSCSTITARVNEEFITSAFYTNEEVVESLGQEMCICLDVALQEAAVKQLLRDSTA
jgi:hypothetical protein